LLSFEEEQALIELASLKPLLELTVKEILAKQALTEVAQERILLEQQQTTTEAV
jgi:hypothetical protein